MCVCLCDPFLCVEFLHLDKQLNELDRALTHLENRSDKLHHEAGEFLLEARAAKDEFRETNRKEEEEEGASHDGKEQREDKASEQ